MKLTTTFVELTIAFYKSDQVIWDFFKIGTNVKGEKEINFPSATTVLKRSFFNLQKGYFNISIYTKYIFFMEGTLLLIHFVE